MLKFRLLSVFFLLFLMFSCSSNQLIGSWQFVDVYDGEKLEVSPLIQEEKTSQHETAVLTFHKNRSFSSMDDSGVYQKKNNILKMKYNDLKDTAQMKITYINHDYLLLFSMTKNPKTWLYKKLNQKRAEE
ncbi:hypothetical protein J2810_003075 [Chryseobacterium rhizosphaerae]|uniref:lipocalin family protein n=1 Tax=Chryseobacterium rhizosphaerae TaxID=395937 RepID=UPI002859CAD4|nr:lipocalin family protein [Chryseobacterium rhizosphaerae]MDR6547005.1 hypothetical protein [Chryseobacterium rhizosphaerae]